MNGLPLAVTAGEPAGIGPDLIVHAASTARPRPWVAVASAEVLRARAAQLSTPLRIERFRSGADVAGGAGVLSVLDVPVGADVVAGRLDPSNSAHVLALLDAAAEGCLADRFSGMVTAPVQKSVINDAGIAFTGHTEWLRHQASVDDVVMMLVAGNLRVALATTHLALRDVPDAITPELLSARIRLLHRALQRSFGLAKPTIGVTGLNPHAGEGGHLGDEEIRVIGPVCEQLRSEGIELVGPLPADTVFVPDRLAELDAVMAMYHDQGLPVLKHAGFGEAVNVTLGLPFVRTSVDHGTALDLAGTGRANAGSFCTAIELAAALAERAAVTAS